VRLFVAALVLLLWTGTCWSAEAPLMVHPVQGLYGPDNSNCATVKAGAPAATVQIAPDLCGQFSLSARADWGRRFTALVNSRFANVRPDLSGPLPAGVTREAMLSQTVIASLHLSRAELWRVDKVSTVDVYMPITLTLMLTNAQTGEVVFSETLSTIVQGPMPRTGYRAQAAREFPDHFGKAMDTLVANAAAHFKPYPIKATVRGRAEAYFVVDAGRRRGLAEGDYLGADARVRYADANYALVEPVLAAIQPGQVLFRQVAQPVASLDKPSVLVFTPGSPPQGDYLIALMEEALGPAAGLAVTPINPSFARIRDDAIGDAGLAARPRALPDYFLRLSVVVLDPAESGTNVRGVRLRTQEARALVEILNRQGRVVFATQGVSRLSDEVVEGMTFAPEQRRDTLTRNAITAAAANIGKSFKPQRLRLAAGPGGDGVSMEDPGNLLSPGARGLLVRKVGPVSGVEGLVWRPLTDVEVTTAGGGRAGGRMVGLASASPRSGDQLAYEATGPGYRERTVISPCTDRAGEIRADIRGQVGQPAFARLAANQFAGRFAGAVYLPDTAPALRRRMAGQFDGLDALGALNPPPSEVCFEAVHKVEPKGERRAGPMVYADYDVTVGFILWAGDRRTGAAALQSRLTATAIRADADPLERDRFLQLDLAVEASKLADQAVGQLRLGQ
jgi:hypothetical protein